MTTTDFSKDRSARFARIRAARANITYVDMTVPVADVRVGDWLLSVDAPGQPTLRYGRDGARIVTAEPRWVTNRLSKKVGADRMLVRPDGYDGYLFPSFVTCNIRREVVA